MFSEVFHQLTISDTLSKPFQEDDVKKILIKPKLNFDDFLILISPAAMPFLHLLANRAHALTLQRFGRTIQLYAPIYLSNICQNQCAYCGFNAALSIKRCILSDDEIVTEGDVLVQKGFQHVLILTGEAPQKTGVAFIKNAITLLKPQFASIGLEVFPMETNEYQDCIAVGADNLTIYQETYHDPTYQKVHIKGKKRDFNFRLNTPDRAGKAGFYRINIGALLGLYDWRYEALALAYH